MRQLAISSSLLFGSLFVGIAIVEAYEPMRSICWFASAFLWFRYAAYAITHSLPEKAAEK